MTSRRIARATGLLALILGCANPAIAALDIYVLDSRYETFVQALSPDPYIGRYDDYDAAYDVTRFQRSPDPLSDYAYAAAYPPYVEAEASAEAKPFEVTSSARVRVDSRAYASASSELTFTALADGPQSLDLSFSRPHPRYFSEGYASLVDVTTNEEYWRYGWSGLLEEQAFFGGGTATNVLEPLATEFFKDHIYKLTLYSEVGVSEDRKYLTIALSGLQIAGAVPEPQTWAMFVLGIAFVGTVVSRRRRGNAAGRP